MITDRFLAMLYDQWSKLAMMAKCNLALVWQL